ncbi:hypothetical protein E2C01_018234 [Portunus trituberculatus]|uniref:Uncharacterized protein n=1 Tax=Portunus trituberculatus TaxID=210409 RepID=A0A5B7DW96_PORTR|nr:hypothetical protein [Portunus trituberculatus]
MPPKHPAKSPSIAKKTRKSLILKLLTLNCRNHPSLALNSSYRCGPEVDGCAPEVDGCSSASSSILMASHSDRVLSMIKAWLTGIRFWFRSSIQMVSISSILSSLGSWMCWSYSCPV